MIDKLESDEVEFNKEEIDDEELDELMEKQGYYKGFFRNEEKYSNAFFTAKACKEHIRLNHYHYKEPRDYLSFGFRNPELELVFKFLCGLTGGNIHL